MISVLIPVYNYNVKSLVEELLSQFNSIAIEFEIICIDDASSLYVEINEKLSKLKNVDFIKLKNNIGRSKIRNLLAEKSNHDWLLFLDADVMPKTNTFIKNYADCIRERVFNVFCGGICYEESKPPKDRLLRWVYGKKREEICLDIRKEYPYRYFLGANFLISKNTFSTIKFNEQIIKYGYEDILFFNDLKNNNVRVKQLKNEVYHLGIENTDVFLFKTRQALDNLKNLNSQGIITKKHIKILRTYIRVKTYNADWLFAMLYKCFNRIFLHNLKGRYPSIFVFDIYKLTYFCNINRHRI